jgi:hypothetical protein
MFRKLEGDSAVLKSNGVLTVVDLYEWRGELYAAVGKGYIRVNANGTTSKDRTALEHIRTDVPLFADRFGRLALVAREGYTAIALTEDGVPQVTGPALLSP